MARRIIGIDAGYVNFAVCGISTADIHRPYYWVNSPLFTGKFTKQRLYAAVYEWINKPEIRQLLTEADEIILEEQMALKFQCVNDCVRFLYFEKTREVNPATIRAFFKLPVKRKQKKKAAVDLVSSHLVLPIKKGKKDDLCDAFLLAFWSAAQATPALTKEWKELQPPQKKMRVLDLV